MAAENLSLSPSATPPDVAAVNTTSKYLPPEKPFISRARINCVHDVSKGAGRYGVRAAVQLLSYGGYRIAEVLGCRWSDVLPGDRVVVHAVKRGTASIAHLPGVSECLFHVPPASRDQFIFSCTYTQVYTHMLSTGWGMQKPGRLNRSVTHTPRNQLATTVVGIEGRAVASNLLHHINSNSLNFYVPPVVYPFVSWTCHLVGLYVWFYPHVDIGPLRCVSAAYMKCVGSYPPGVSSQGGIIPAHPSNSDPCMSMTNVPWSGIALRYWSGNQFPVTATLRIWLGLPEYSFTHVYQQSELT